MPGCCARNASGQAAVAPPNWQAHGDELFTSAPAGAWRQRCGTRITCVRPVCGLRPAAVTSRKSPSLRSSGASSRVLRTTSRIPTDRIAARPISGRQYLLDVAQGPVADACRRDVRYPTLAAFGVGAARRERARTMAGAVPNQNTTTPIPANANTGLITAASSPARRA